MELRRRADCSLGLWATPPGGRLRRPGPLHWRLEMPRRLLTTLGPCATIEAMPASDEDRWRTSVPEVPRQMSANEARARSSRRFVLLIVAATVALLLLLTLVLVLPEQL